MATYVTFFSQKLFSYQVLNLGNSIKTFRFIVMMMIAGPPPACLLVNSKQRGLNGNIVAIEWYMDHSN